MEKPRDVKARLRDNWLDLVHTVTGEIIQEFHIQQAEDKHRNFIISTWVKSYRGTARKNGFQEFYDRHEPSIAEGYWQDCYVATDEDGFTVYAWVCASQGRLYHCYTVPELRKLGMANGLVKHRGGLEEYARPWPFAQRARVNPYLLGDRFNG